MNGLNAPEQAWWLWVPLALLLLYLFRPRHRPQPVAAAFLWSAAAEQLSGQNLWRRLQHNRLLWLQLLVCLALVAGLMRPYQIKPGLVAPQVVLLLDTSASMAAGKPAQIFDLRGVPRLPRDPPRIQQALAQARQIVEQAPSGSQILLASLDRELRVWQPLSEDRVGLLRALDQIQVRAVRGRDELASPFFLSLQKNAPHIQLHWFSDHALAGVNHVPHLFTQGRTNYAIESFQADSQRLFLALRNYDPEPVSLRLRVRNPAGFQIDRSYSLRGRGRRLLQLDCAGQVGPFRAELLTGDDFPLDNQAWALAPEAEQLRLLAHGPVSAYLEQAAQAASGAPLIRADESARDAEGIHLWVQLPEQPGPGLHIAEGPPSRWLSGAPIQDEGPLLLSPAWQQRLGFRVASRRWGQRLRLGSDRLKQADLQTVLADAAGQPLLVSGSRALVFLFPLEESELPLSPELPVLLSGWLQSNRNPWQGLGGLLCDSRVRLPESLPVSGPRGQEKLEGSDWTPTWPGLYRVGTHTLAVNYHSPEESALASSPPPLAPPAAGPEASAEQRPMSREWTLSLAALALALLMLEFRWWRRC